jgi:hypothetical protein
MGFRRPRGQKGFNKFNRTDGIRQDIDRIMLDKGDSQYYARDYNEGIRDYTGQDHEDRLGNTGL